MSSLLALDPSFSAVLSGEPTALAKPHVAIKVERDGKEQVLHVVTPRKHTGLKGLHSAAIRATAIASAYESALLALRVADKQSEPIKMLVRREVALQFGSIIPDKLMHPLLDGWCEPGLWPHQHAHGYKPCKCGYVPPSIEIQPREK